MAVDDAELLALAGGDSSDEEDTQEQTSTHRNANSPLPSIEISHSSNNRSSTGKSRHSPSLKPHGVFKMVKKSREPESEEEGEASSSRGSPDTLQSAPMSESDSGLSAADPSRTEDNPYPVENRFKSEKDRKEILALPEVDREAILAERAQEVERNVQDQHLRRLLQARENAEAKAAKRKAPIDLEESPRKSTRQKTTLGGRKVGEASKQIEAYKRQREEKVLKSQQRKAGALGRQKDRARSSSEGRFSSADADGESEVEWADDKAKSMDERFRTAQPGDYNDFRRVTLPRNFLAEFCYNPGFESQIRDCYVRLPMPQKAGSGVAPNAYQLVQIKSVFEKESWPYAMMKQTGRKFVTSQHLMLAVDGTQKEFHMNSVSNSTPTEVEVANHKNTLANEGRTIPSQPFLVGKIDDINSVINHHFTEAELQRKLERSGISKMRNVEIEKTALKNRLKLASDRSDQAAVAKCEAELGALIGPKLRYGTTLGESKPSASPAPSEPSQQDRLAELNRINRQKNTADVRKAQKAEMKAKRAAQEAIARGEAVEDPFARVKTKARTHYDVHETLAPHRMRERDASRNASRSATPNIGTPKLKPRKLTPTGSPHVKPLLKNGLPVLGSRHMDEEIISAMDMGIDIEI